MRYSDLDHIIRAAYDVLKGEPVYIVGSQSILPWLRKQAGIPPRKYNTALTISREVDIIPFSGSESSADEIDGSLGEFSRFDDTNGYYAEGIGFNTITVTPDWKGRCMPIKDASGETLAYCMHPIDLFIAKSCAMREKDGPFLDVMIAENLVRPQSVLHQLPKLRGVISDEKFGIVAQQIKNRFKIQHQKNNIMPKF